MMKKNYKNGFTVVSQDITHDRKLHIRERGMLLTLLSLPDDWKFSISGLHAILGDGITTIRTSIKKLERLNYLVRTQAKHSNGQFGSSEWEVRDFSESPLSENLTTVNLMSEKDTQVNTNKLNTNKLKEKSVKEKNYPLKKPAAKQKLTSTKTQERFVPPSLLQIKEYLANKQINVNAERFHSYYESVNWMRRNNLPIKNWKACITAWQTQEKRDSNKKDNRNNADLTSMNMQKMIEAFD